MKTRLKKHAAAIPAVVRMVEIHRIEHWLEVKLWVSTAALSALDDAGLDAGGEVRRLAPHDDFAVASHAARWGKPCGVGVKSAAWLRSWMLDAPAQREITFTINPARWQNIERTAAMIGVSAADVCLASIGYSAMLEMTKPRGVAGVAVELVPPQAVVQAEVTVPASVLKDLASLEEAGYALKDQVAEHCFTRGGVFLDRVAARWGNANRRMGCAAPLAAVAARLEEEASRAGAAEVLKVPLTTAAAADLARICHRLGIAPEAWLRGIVGALAIRGARCRGYRERRLAKIEDREKRKRKP
jgi:hypothetical protein